MAALVSRHVQLAINLVSPVEGMIAFDEFHQAMRNAERFCWLLCRYPVLPIAGQIVLLSWQFYDARRRFGRPLPLPRVDRRSSLEFVASMAELQQRARAYDLAIETLLATRQSFGAYCRHGLQQSRF